MIVPKKESLMLFGAWFGDKYADNAKYLYEYVLKNHQEYIPIWMTKNEAVFKELKSKNMPVCKTKSIKSISLAARAKYIFWCTDYVRDIGAIGTMFMGNCTLINLWHGIPLKKIMYDDIHNDFHNHPLKYAIERKLLSIPLHKSFMIASSKEIAEIYQSAFKLSSSQIIDSGQPRHDFFYQTDDNPLRQKYGNKKIIVYLPTHRNEGATRMNMECIFDLARLDDLCQKNNCIFIIKKHFYHKNEPRIDDKYESVKEITEDKSETQELLKAADVLVTDFSSCYIDYLLMDRPIIFYAYDFDEYLKVDRELYFEGIDTEPGDQCRNYEEFEKAMIDVLNGKDHYKDERRRVREIFFGNNAGKVACPIIMKKIKDL